MVSNLVTAVFPQSQSGTTLNQVTTLDLATEFEVFLLAGRVEGKSSETLHQYGWIIKRFLRQASSADSRGIREYILTLQDSGLAPMTVHAHYRCLKAFFNWLVREEKIHRSPMWNIRPPEVPKYIISPFSKEEIDALLAQCHGRHGERFVDLRDRALLLIFLDTGLRLTEMASIQLPDMDIERGTIKVMGKGRKERTVRIGKGARMALWRYLLKRRQIPDSYSALWLTEERKPLSRWGVASIMRYLCQYAGITRKKRGVHTLRHTAATLNRTNGMTIENVQTLLGHASPETTRRYLLTFDRTGEMLKAHEITSPVDRLGLR